MGTDIDSPELLEQVFARVTGCSYLIDVIECRLVRALGEASAVLGYSNSELQSMDVLELACLVHPEDMERLREHLVRLESSLENEVVEVEYRLQHKSGDWRWFRGRNSVLNRTAEGRLARIVGAATEISERKKAEQLLRKQNERLRLLWETVGILLATDNAETMLQGLFEKLSKQMNVDTCFNFMVNEQGDALQLQFSAGVPAEAAASLSRLEFGQAICGTVAARRQPIVASFIQQSDNPMVQVVKALGIRAYACNPLIAGGQLLGTLSFASRRRDRFDEDELEFIETITKYVTLAYDRLRLLSQLRQRDRRKDEFLAMLAHELRNPLAAIRSTVDYLDVKGLEDPDVAWARDLIDRQVTSLVHLIDDLMEISRVTRGMIKLRQQPASLNLLLRHAIDSVQPLLEEKGHQLDLDLAAESLGVFGDPTRLEQVFANLLINAVKYTDDGGSILVESRPDEDHAIVRIRDDGIGIPSEMFAHIFEPFTQLDRSLARSKGGLGIGLTLVKSFTEMHGGTISVKSAGPGSGSEFIVRLPLAQNSVAREKGDGDSTDDLGWVRRSKDETLPAAFRNAI
jgi:PAS domain S-box-containing protein